MGPLDDIYTVNYTKNPTMEFVTRSSSDGHVSVYDGSKWVTTPGSTPPGTYSTGTSTSSVPSSWKLPKVDLLNSIRDDHIRAATEDLMYADAIAITNDDRIEHINSAIKLLSKRVVELLGED